MYGFQHNINCYSRVDKEGFRYLLGDFAGHIYLLQLETDVQDDGSHIVKDLKINILGEVRVPYT